MSGKPATASAALPTMPLRDEAEDCGSAGCRGEFILPIAGSSANEFVPMGSPQVADRMNPCSPAEVLRMNFPRPFLRVIVFCFVFATISAAGEIPMRVKFSMEGGIAYFPALSEPVLIDSEKLSAEDRDELQRRVEAAHFFDLPAQAGSAPRGAADYHTYVITVSAKGREHTIRVTDVVGDPAIKNLVAFLKAKAEALRDKQ